MLSTATTRSSKYPAKSTIPHPLSPPPSSTGSSPWISSSWRRITCPASSMSTCQKHSTLLLRPISIMILNLSKSRFKKSRKPSVVLCLIGSTDTIKALIICKLTRTSPIVFWRTDSSKILKCSSSSAKKHPPIIKKQRNQSSKLKMWRT